MPSPIRGGGPLALTPSCPHTKSLLAGVQGRLIGPGSFRVSDDLSCNLGAIFNIWPPPPKKKKKGVDSPKIKTIFALEFFLMIHSPKINPSHTNSETNIWKISIVGDHLLTISLGIECSCTMGIIRSGLSMLHVVHFGGLFVEHHSFLAAKRGPGVLPRGGIIGMNRG